MQGDVFVPMHWSDQFASAGRVDALVAAHTDPVSGQPELKFMPVAMAPFAARWHGLIVTATRPAALDLDYWAVAPRGSGWSGELAGGAVPDDWSELASEILGTENDDEMLAYYDGCLGQYRFARSRGAVLMGVLYMAPTPITVPRG